ncbi:MAG: hypothetical protein SOX32_12655 [Candidatus Choladocola sp.]|nr:hypothetical protein [Candidatus Choladocola sp.]
MTDEEKLKHFEDSVIGRAREESGEMLKQYQISLDQEQEDYRAAQNQQALKKIKTEIGNLKREYNTTFAKEQVSIRRRLSEKEGELTVRLFDEVTEKLKQYREKPEYDVLLEEQIRRIREKAGQRELKIQISPLDQSRKEKLEAATGTVIEIGNDTFLGGTRGFVDHGRIRIDYSFDTRLEELRADFTLGGGESRG